jgi:ATP-dependent helicase Lhr and Lhr-like helicase
VRRGWFVDGLSGAQFALPEAARMLQDLSLPSYSQAPMVLLSSVDPANLYGGPLEVPDEMPRPFSRRPSNWLVLRAGKPVLLVEQHGKRVTTLASNEDEVAAAAVCLPAMITNNPRRDLRTKLTVEEWNGQPVTATAGKDLLAAAGFVRDYQAMTLYAVWSK